MVWIWFLLAVNQWLHVVHVQLIFGFEYEIIKEISHFNTNFRYNSFLCIRVNILTNSFHWCNGIGWHLNSGRIYFYNQAQSILYRKLRNQCGKKSKYICHIVILNWYHSLLISVISFEMNSSIGLYISNNFRRLIWLYNGKHFF